MIKDILQTKVALEILGTDTRINRLESRTANFFKASGVRTVNGQKPDGLGDVTITTADSTFTNTLVSKTANYTATSNDAIILCDATGGSFSITLPTAVGISGRLYTIKRLNSGANTVTLATTSAQTIDGSSSAVIKVQNQSLTVISDNANWQIV